MKKKCDINSLSSRDRQRLGMFIDMGGDFPKSKIHKSIGRACCEKGLLVDVNDMWIVPFSWVDAYKKHFVVPRKGFKRSLDN